MAGFMELMMGWDRCAWMDGYMEQQKESMDVCMYERSSEEGGWIWMRCVWMDKWIYGMMEL